MTPLDALVIINHLNAGGTDDVLSLDVDAPFLDSNADGRIAPIDVLAMINHLNRPAGTPAETLLDEAIEQLTYESTLGDLPDLITDSLIDDANAGRLLATYVSQKLRDETGDSDLEAVIDDLFGDGGDEIL